jgi:hypothetical protein
LENFSTPITLVENSNQITGLGAQWLVGGFSDNLSNFMEGWLYQWSLKMTYDEAYIQA